MVRKLEAEAKSLELKLAELSGPSGSEQIAQRYDRFFSMAKGYAHIDRLDRDTLIMFVDRIEVSPKRFADGLTKATHRNTPFTQEIKIFYKFIGRLEDTDDWSRILSLGEQQRIAFARVLLVRPDWIFLDEATSALDETREARLYDLLRSELPDAGLVSVAHRSTLFARHDSELSLADRTPALRPITAN